MLSQKLITLLETFNGHQLNQFRKYLNSPFFNEDETLIVLFELLDPLLRQEGQPGQSTAQQLRKKDVWKTLYGNRPFQDSKLRRLCSELTQHVFTFLSLQNYRQDPLQEIIHVLPEVNKLQLSKHFNGLLRQADRLTEKSELRNATYHYHQYLIKQQSHLFREKIEQKFTHFDELEQSDYHLDCFYVTQKLRHYCNELGYRSFSAREARIKLPPGFPEWLTASPLLEEPSVKAYYLIFRLLSTPEEADHFAAARDFLRENSTCFSPGELNTLYIFLKNYCITQKINAGHTDYFRELFDIFRTLLEKDILLENGVLDHQDYKNIITVGLQVKAFDWVEAFIQHYTGKLLPAYQENALTYNLAKVYFHQQEYDKVIGQLREVAYSDQVYALGSKLMLLKTYYELDEFLALDSLIASFRIYLRRNRRISREVKQQYMNVLRLVKKLSNVAPYDEKALLRIEQQIASCPALAAKDWLLAKVAERQRGTGATVRA